jgi:Flp pilus assembly pilin Flp
MASNNERDSAMSSLLRRLAGIVTDRKGVSAAEYAILAVGIVVVVGGAASAFKAPLASAFTSIGTKITATQSTSGN